MRSKVWKYLKIAAAEAMRNQDDQRSYWIGACAVRNDGTLVRAYNGPAQNKTRKVHAEYRLSNKIDHEATVYVARVRAGNKSLAIAKPCRACQKVLASRNVKKVYYTVSDKEYRVFIP